MRRFFPSYPSALIEEFCSCYTEPHQSVKLLMICDLLALRPISHITQKTLSYLHSTKIEQITKTMVISKRGAIFLCCVRCDPIPPKTSVQRLAHTRNVTTCCSQNLPKRSLGDVLSLRHPNHFVLAGANNRNVIICLLYTSPSPRDGLLSRMPSSA